MAVKKKRKPITTNKVKGRRVPAAMAGVQKDALQDARDQKLTSVSQALKDGKIDHGESARPGKGGGVLDPREFEKFEVAVRAHKTETQRLATVIKTHLDKDHNPRGDADWQVAFFLESDPRSKGVSGHQVLTKEALGSAWHKQLQHELGLTEYNGALCWNGRGTVERHIICVKTKELQMRQLLAAEEHSRQSVRQPGQVAGKNVGRLEVTEKVRKLPLIPVGDGTKDQGDASMTD